VADSQKHTLFAIKMENQIFMKQILKPYLEELFGMRRCTHLPSLGALLLCMLMFAIYMVTWVEICGGP
jgi:hypothetical protein